MKIIPSMSVPAQDVVSDDVKGIKIRWVIDDTTGAPNFAMRIFDIEPGGYTPKHKHDWEHEVYVIEGEGTAFGEAGDRPFRKGDAVFVPGGEMHQFTNTGSGLLRVMCLIPLSGKV